MIICIILLFSSNQYDFNSDDDGLITNINKTNKSNVGYLYGFIENKEPFKNNSRYILYLNNGIVTFYEYLVEIIYYNSEYIISYNFVNLDNSIIKGENILCNNINLLYGNNSQEWKKNLTMYSMLVYEEI